MMNSPTAADAPAEPAVPLSPRPLLSICIPTYNRAEWLRQTLAHSLPQVAATNGLAELVISDNASPDHTQQVVEQARCALGPIRYHRNETNIGGHANFHRCAKDLAQGEFVWVVGDDDFLKPGAVARVLEVLQARPDLDYVYVNYVRFPVDGVPDKPVTVADLDALDEFGSRDFGDRYVERVADLINDDYGCFTSVYVSVFRRADAVEAFEGSLHDPNFATLESVASHATFIVERLFDKPCWYLGHPYVATAADYCWTRYGAVYMLVLIPELYDRIEKAGVDRRRLDRFRRRLLTRSGGLLHQMLSDRTTYGRERFHFGRYLWRHRHWWELTVLLRNVAITGLWNFRPTARVMHHGGRLLRWPPAGRR